MPMKRIFLVMLTSVFLVRDVGAVAEEYGSCSLWGRCSQSEEEEGESL